MADSGVGRPDHAEIRDPRELIAQARRELWWFIETYTDEDEDTVARAMTIQDDLLYPALQGVVALLGEVERLTKQEADARHVLTLCVPWVAASGRGMAQEALAKACELLGIDPFDWTNHPDVLKARIELLAAVKP